MTSFSYRRKSYSTQRPPNYPTKNKTFKEQFSYAKSDVFQASCAAFRINSGFFKTDEIAYDEHGEVDFVKHYANKKVVYDILNLQAHEITQEDKDFAEKVMSYCGSPVVEKILADKPVTDYENTMIKISNLVEINSSYDVAIIASLPNSYFNNLARKESNRKINESVSGYIADIGEKITNLELKIIHKFFSNNICAYHYTCHTADQHLVTFWKGDNVGEQGDNIMVLSAKVKDHRENNATLINYTKFSKNG